jgi:hypothetical protein
MNQKVIRTKILIPLLEDSYRAEYTEYARRNLRCSDAGAAADEGDKCEREIYYDFTIPEKKSLLTSGTLVLFDDGRIHEQDIRRRLRLVLRSPERELTDPDLGARGKIDNMVDSRKVVLPVEGEPGQETPIFPKEDPVLELKSVNEYAYQDMARSGRINQSYYDQVQYYLFLTGISWAICLIKNRNSSGDEKGVIPFLEFVVFSDAERQAQLRAGLATIKECVEKKIIPPRPFLKDSTKCSYCRFKFECWGAELAPAPALEPDKTVEAPAQEILESAIRTFHNCNKAAKELEKMQEEARSVIERYFKATAAPEIISGNIKAAYSISEGRILSREILLKSLTPVLYSTIAKPDRGLLETAIANRMFDAGILESAFVPSGKKTARLLVNEVKGMVSERQKQTEKEKSDDKGTIGDQKNTAARAHKARNKGKKSKRNGVSKRGRLLPNRSKNPRSKVELRVEGAVHRALRG